MNSAAFGGSGWKRTHEDRRGKFSLRSRSLNFLPKLALVIPLPSLSNRVRRYAKPFRRYAASRHTPVAFESRFDLMSPLQGFPSATILSQRRRAGIMNAAAFGGWGWKRTR